MSQIYFGHEKLVVYQLSLNYVAKVYEISDKMGGHNRHARDQLFRASQSIALNIAEGNGKTSDGDRRRYFEIARGSALECASIQDILQIGKAITETENNQGKEVLSRIVGMLTKLSKMAYCVNEDVEFYGIAKEKDDYDCDRDRDSDVHNTAQS